MKAESSTMRQVSGARCGAISPVISNMIFLHVTTLSYSRNQMRGDVCEGKHMLNAATLHSDARHAVDRTTGLVLRDGVAAGAANLAEAASAVAAHAGQNHRGRRRPETLGDRIEQHIHRRHVTIYRRARLQLNLRAAC